MKWRQTLEQPVDIAPLAIFRIIFGLLIFLEAWGAIATGWVKKAFITVNHTFPFIDLSWLQPLPGDGMYYYYVVMGIAGLLVMLGLFYRPAIILYTIMWAGVYFMQKTNYNNHYYLLLLLLGIMSVLPANRYASLDVKRNPLLKSETCARGIYIFIIAHLWIVYTYASIAKIYPDWLDATPIAIWFKAKEHYFLIGSLLQEKWLHYVIAYGGIAFDGLVIPALLFKPTRKPAFIIGLFFHLFNSFVFQVGIFPYLAISWALFFFPPETARKFFLKKKSIPLPTEPHRLKPVVIYAFTLYLVIQALLPLRHHLYEGNVFWTEEGHRLSWRMMLRSKSGSIHFKVIDRNTGKEFRINPLKYVTSKQTGLIATRPDFCWQFVQILKEDFNERGMSDIEVYADGMVSLNGGPYGPLYDPSIDLAKVDWEPFKHSHWLVPMPDGYW